MHTIMARVYFYAHYHGTSLYIMASKHFPMTINTCLLLAVNDNLADRKWLKHAQEMDRSFG